MGIKQGILDSLLKANANSSVNAYEDAKKRQQTEQQNQANRDAEIAKLIQGDQLKQQAIDSNVARAQQQATANGMKPGKFSVAANEGGFSVNPEGDSLASLLGIQNRDDKSVERLSQRVSKEHIPERAADFVSLESATKGEKDGGIITNPNYKPKSAGFNQWLPNMIRGPVVSAAESMGFMEKGSGAETQALQRLMNTEIKSNSGTAVSAHEQGRNDLAAGMKSNNPDMIRRGVQQIKRALEMDTQNIEGSAPAHIKNQYRDQGGEYDVNRMLGAPTNGGFDDAKKKRLEELRAKKAAGTIR